MNDMCLLETSLVTLLYMCEMGELVQKQQVGLLFFPTDFGFISSIFDSPFRHGRSFLSKGLAGFTLCYDTDYWTDPQPTCEESPTV